MGGSKGIPTIEPIADHQGRERLAAEDVHARLSTRGFVGHPGVTIVGATFAGLGLMSLTFMLGLPVLFALVGLFAGILLVLGLGGGDMTISLTDTGIVRTFRPFAAKYIRLPARRQVFGFDDIRSYRRDRDLSRSKQEYAYLRLRLKRPPFRVTINDMSGSAAFETFADAFEKLAGQMPSDVNGKPEDKAVSAVRREKGFYDTPFAKFLTIALVVVAVGLSVLLFTGEVGGTNLFRVTVIIIPGALYLLYRTFGWRRLR